jgi:outer membrane protein TolC
MWFIIHGSWFMVYGQPDSLSHYLQVAGNNNPAVQAALHDYEAALQKIPQMGALEDPRLDIGFFPEPMELVGGREIAQFQLMQMFPWFGTRKAAQTEAQHMARMAFEQFREARDNLYLQVCTQWYLLCSLQQKLLNSEANGKLLEQLETLALRKFSSGGNRQGNASTMPGGNTSGTTGISAMNMPAGNTSGMNMGSNMAKATQPAAISENMPGAMPGNMGQAASGMSEVLRIQLEKAELENAVNSIRSEIIAGKARFNALLNRPAKSEVVIPGKILQIPYILDTESVIQTVAVQNPTLGMLKEEALAYNAKAKMVAKMGYPMFGIGLQYMLIGKTKTGGAGTGMQGMSGMDASATMPASSMSGMNGKDMIMPMVSVTIPVFRSKYKAAKKEAQLQQQASEARYTGVLHILEAELTQSKHQLDNAARNIELYRKQAALAQTTYKLVVQEFVSNKSDLSSVIQVQRQLLDYQLKEAEATASYNTMVASIRKMISEPLFLQN